MLNKVQYPLSNVLYSCLLIYSLNGYKQFKIYIIRKYFTLDEHLIIYILLSMVLR